MGRRNPLLFALAAAIAFAVASPSRAEDQSPPSRSAHGIIEAARLTGVFEPVEADHISVRHIASGLVCDFFPDDRHIELMVFPGELPRGDDVGCIANEESKYTTFYATRYAPPMSVENALAEAVMGIRQRYPDARATPNGMEISSEGLPPARAAHFFITIRGERWISSAHVARVGDWVIKLRYSARCVSEEEVTRHQLEAGLLMTHALLGMTGERK